ncbi:hypothetical protein CGRA01v4_07373 [Colletotrichum graminicola]|nr:hypothetical protein CGRA01v4_07373 [Colletotrichum graminicola]
MNNTQALHQKYTVHPLCDGRCIRSSKRVRPPWDAAAQTAHRPGQITGPNPSWSPIDQAHDLKRGWRGSRNCRLI